MDIRKYAYAIVAIIIEDISSVPLRSFGDEYLGVEEWFVMMNEFLIYDLHICDRFLFSRWGNDLREKLMKEIMPLISKHMEKAREEVLNKQFKNLSLENLPHYFKTLRATPTGEWIITSLNQKQRKYSQYKLIKEYPKTGSWDGLLEWEFAKDLAALLKREKRQPFVLALWTQAMDILPKLARVPAG